MAVPPRGDPRRPLHLAASSCRAIGILALLGGTCMGAEVVTLLSRVRLGPGGRATPLAVALVPTFMICFVGAAYLVLAWYLKLRRFWAVVSALGLTVVLLLLEVFGLGSVLVLVALEPPVAWGDRSFWVAVAVYGLIATALGQLVYRLARSFPALSIAPPDEGRGFDVLPLAVLPAGPGEGP